MKIYLLLLLPLFTSCSVVLASKKEGIHLDALQHTHTRSELLALGAKPIATETTAQGQLIEIYRILQEKGSITRAVMHGILDLSTGFLWEFAATPIESALVQKKYYTAKVTYGEDERIDRIEF